MTKDELMNKLKARVVAKKPRNASIMFRIPLDLLASLKEYCNTYNEANGVEISLNKMIVTFIEDKIRE